MALYRRGIGGSGEAVYRYTSSMEDDREIAANVVRVLRAHVEHLCELGLAEDCGPLLEVLNEVPLDELAAYRSEDIHEALEKYLMDRLGRVAGWVGLGRSRNDHVAAAIRLTLMDRLDELATRVLELRRTLLRLAERYADCVVPTYTHGQPAQVGTLGHYMLALDEALEDHMEVMGAARRVVDRSPLGSAAASGTTVPLDRHRLASLAGFSDVVVNTLYATGSRAFANLACGVVVGMLVELSRFVEDLITWSSPQVGFVEPPIEHVATSSIMPHKRNPVTLEVLRARIAESLGHYVALLAIQMSLRSGYSLDLQEATRHIWAIMRIAADGVDVLADFLSGAVYRCDRMSEEAARYPITSSDAAEMLSMGGRVPYREAYFRVAEEVGRGTAVLPRPGEALRMRRVLGSPNPEEVRRMALEKLSKLDK